MKTILVSAYACEPLKGSEQGVGWNWVLQLAKNNYVHVITRANNQEFIDTHLPKSVSSNITFHYYDTHKYIKRLKNKAKGLYLYYFFWQIGILPSVSKIIKENNPDYTMHLTMGSIWMPTFLHLFKVPFIWGPMGGGEGIPKSFIKSLPNKDKLIQGSRYFFKYLWFFNPLFLFRCLKSKIIIVRTKNTLSFIPKWYRKKCKVFLETSMENDVFKHLKKVSNSNKIQIITTGRLVPFKNIICLIDSLQYLPSDKDISLTIIGSGSEKKRILSRLNSISTKVSVNLLSELPREGVLNKLEHSDIYVFPSLREGGSWALMEAMAIGLPVICLKWSGMEIITDELSAIQLPVTNPEQMPKDLANAISELINNPNKRKRMGDAARERIKSDFNWDSKGAFMEKLFTELDKNN